MALISPLFHTLTNLIFVPVSSVDERKMAVKPLLLLHSSFPKLTPEFFSEARASTRRQRTTPIQAQLSRRALMAASTTVAIALANVFDEKSASGVVDFEIMATEQTMEEAQSGIRGHADSLLEVRALIESESWKEARSFLRRSASYVKRDFYTIIQNSPTSQRKELRKLYSVLFNNVSRLEFAARDKDKARVLQCYDNISVALTDIFSRI